MSKQLTTDIINKYKPKHSFLTVLGLSRSVKRENNRGYIHYYKCICKCGKLTESIGTEIKNGHTISCGCFRKKQLDKTTHGYCKLPIYSVWTGIKKRCYQVNCKSYKNYGGRGITMCKRWRYNPKYFIEDMQSGYIKGLYIDRKDNNKGYSKSNCHWVTNTVNSRNKRNTKLSWKKVDEIRDSKLSNKELTVLYGVNSSHISAVLHNKIWVR